MAAPASGFRRRRGGGSRNHGRRRRIPGRGGRLRASRAGVAAAGTCHVADTDWRGGSGHCPAWAGHVRFAADLGFF